MSSRDDTPEPGTSDGNAGRARDEGQENAPCPECRDVSTACSSSCRHCFCQLCLWDWSLGRATCPRCQRPIRHPYPQHVALYHEVQDRVYDGKRRWRRRPWSCSGYSQPRERRRTRSVRWPRDGRWHRWGSDSPRRRWWQQRRDWEDTRGEGRAPRFEWDVPASSRGRRSRRRSRWRPRHRSRHRSRRSWSQQEQPWAHHGWRRDRERSHSWDRRRGRSSRRDQHSQPGSHGRSTRQRRWRSWNADDRHTPRPQHDVPSGSSETPQWEDSDSSRHQHMTRRRTQGRSHRRGHSTQAGSREMGHHNRSRRQRRWRSWNADQGRAPWSQQDSPRPSWRSRRRSRSRAGRRDM